MFAGASGTTQTDCHQAQPAEQRSGWNCLLWQLIAFCLQQGSGRAAL